MSDVQIQEIDFETVRSCQDVKRLKKMIQLLKEEPYYPQLLQSAVDRLFELSPDSAFEMTPAAALDAPCQADVISFREWISEQMRLDQDNDRNAHALQIDVPGSQNGTRNRSVSAAERRAKNEKNIGNEYFKSQDYSTAIKHYTRAIGLAPSNSDTLATSFFNRANCNFQLKLWRKCEKDATCALDVDPDYVKALFLRAKARDSLDKLGLAVDDLELCLRLNPDNNEISSYLQKIKSKLPLVVEDDVVEGKSFTRLKIVEVDEDNEDGGDGEYGD